MATEAQARQGDRGAEGTAVATTHSVQANRNVAAAAAENAAVCALARSGEARIAEQVEDGFDGDL